MKTNIIKSKNINNGILKLVELLTDDSKKIIGYLAMIAYKQRDVNRGGAGKLEEIKFGNDKNKALDFFNSQT